LAVQRGFAKPVTFCWTESHTLITHINTTPSDSAAIMWLEWGMQ